MLVFGRAANMADHVAELFGYLLQLYLAGTYCDSSVVYSTISLSHLQALDQVSVRPPDLLREASEHAEAAAGRHLDDLKGVGHDHTLLRVVGERDALEALHITSGDKGERSGRRSNGSG